MLWFGISGHKACGILALQPGIEPTLPALEGKVNQTAREFPLVYLYNEEECARATSRGLPVSSCASSSDKRCLRLPSGGSQTCQHLSPSPKRRLRTAVTRLIPPPGIWANLASRAKNNSCPASLQLTPSTWAIDTLLTANEILWCFITQHYVATDKWHTT